MTSQTRDDTRDQYILDQICLGRSLRAIGCDLDISGERVRQIVARSLKDQLPDTILLRCESPDCGQVFEYPLMTTGGYPKYCCDKCKQTAQRRRRGRRPQSEVTAQWEADRQTMRELRAQGLTAKEIAERLNMHAPTVQVKLARHAPMGMPYQHWRRLHESDSTPETAD